MDPVALILLLFVAALVLLGLVEPGKAFAGFGSDTVLTLPSLFILMRMLLRAGVIEWIGAALTRRSRHAGGPLRALLSTVAGVSAFTSNTATTAVFLPVVAGVARGGQAFWAAPSRSLAPARTSWCRARCRPLGFFELAWVSLPAAVAGLLYLFFIAPRLLPARDAGSYLADLTVVPGSALTGQTLRGAGLGRDYGLNVVAVRRGQDTFYAPGAEFRVEASDTLTVKGPTERILAGRTALGVISKSEQKLEPAAPGSVRLVEAVVMPGSPLVGRTLKEARFRERYGLSVLALHRRAPDRAAGGSARAGGRRAAGPGRRRTYRRPG